MCLSNKNSSLWQWGHKVGMFFVFLFIICFAWYFINPVWQDLHLKLLELFFIGYEGMGFVSFINGLVQSYVWGYIVVLIWKLVLVCSPRNKNVEKK